MPQNRDELNIAQVLSFLRRRGFWIVACFILAVIAAFAYSKHQTKKYTASAALSFSNDSLNEEIAGLPTSASSSTQQQAANLELLRLGNLAAKTATIIGHGQTAQTVAGSLTIEGQPESSIATVSVTSASPKLAAEVANTYARQFVNEQGEADHSYFRSALALVRKQLAALSPAQRLGTDGVDLQDREQSLAFLVGLRTSNVDIAQTAVVPTQPSSPKTKRNMLIGGLLGLFLGVTLALLLERLDPRIRRPEQLASIYGVPLLGTVPKSAGIAKSMQTGDDARDAMTSAIVEAFHMIRARLRASNGDRDIRVVLVTSASSADGKTTVAWHLANAGARMGSTVLLLEADLRNPTLAKKMGVHVQAGITEVLNGTAGIDSAVQSVGSSTMLASKEPAGTMRVLLAGPSTSANPVGLIESRAMDELLEGTKSRYDLVVIDAPDLTSVSDAFLLLSKVEAVIIVGRMGRSRRDVAERLSKVLQISKFPLAGAIANGVQPSSLDLDSKSTEQRSAGMHDTSVDSTSTAAESVLTAKT